jgi:hypothetical protein
VLIAKAPENPFRVRRRDRVDLVSAGATVLEQRVLVRAVELAVGHVIAADEFTERVEKLLREGNVARDVFRFANEAERLP